MSPGLRHEGDGVNHSHKSLPRSRSKPLNDVLFNSKVLSEPLETPKGRDGSPRISQGCKTCSTGSSCQGAVCSLRAICGKGGKTVGSSRRGANHVGEAVGGRQATSSETLRGSLPVTNPSTSQQIGEHRLRVCNRWSTRCSRSGMLSIAQIQGEKADVSSHGIIARRVAQQGVGPGHIPVMPR